VLLAIFAGGYWRTTPQAPITPTSPSLVVLPLHSAGNAQDEAILAEALTSELTTRLARTQGLRLIWPTSARRAQAEKLGPQALGERLHVTHALEGSLRQTDRQLHIELHLSHLADGRTLWSQTYDRELGEMSAVERDIAQAAAAALALHLDAGDAERADADMPLLIEYLQARQLANGQEHARGVERLRALIAKAPDYARAHAALARTLAGNLRPAPIAADEFEEASKAAARAFELDPNLADTQAARAILACRSADWPHCLDSFRRAIALDPADADSRGAYAYWLAGLGYVDAASHEVEFDSASDPLSYNANFAHARVLDTLGRHDEALGYLGAATPASAGLVYARWHNAIWRQDLSAARKFAADMPQSDGFRESYAGVTEALADPSRWSQVQPLIGTSERATGRINILRIMMPDPDFAVELTGLERMLRDGWPSYYLLLWMPEYSAMRRAPAFGDFLQRTRLIDYWRGNGWPPQCRPAGDGAACD
jgi:TolB-like protein